MVEYSFNRTESPKVRAYEIDFDVKAYQMLSSLRFINHEEYGNRKNDLDTLTRRQFETYLGERLHVLASMTKYNITEGQLIGENQSEPIQDIIIRGRDWRRVHGNSVDFAREDAEVEGIAKIQDVLLDSETPVGTIMLSISPPGNEGTIYKQNFYDIFTLKDDGQGRYVEARRYSSDLSKEEYAEKVGRLKEIPFIPTDVYFLADPIRMSPDDKEFGSAELIHEGFHREHKFMRQEDFDKVLKECTPYIGSYIDALNNNTLDKRFLNLIHDAILNIADKARDGLKTSDNVAQNIYEYGNAPVRETDSGCGYSGGLFGSLGVSSVAEFGSKTDKYGSREVPCPKCPKVNLRPVNGFLKRCGNQFCPNPTAIAC